MAVGSEVPVEFKVEWRIRRRCAELLCDGNEWNPRSRRCEANRFVHLVGDEGALVELKAEQTTSLEVAFGYVGCERHRHHHHPRPIRLAEPSDFCQARRQVVYEGLA